MTIIIAKYLIMRLIVWPKNEKYVRVDAEYYFIESFPDIYNYGLPNSLANFYRPNALQEKPAPPPAAATKQLEALFFCSRFHVPINPRSVRVGSKL